MSTTANAHMFTAAYPLVCTDDTLVLVFRDHGGAVKPAVIITASTSDVLATIKSGADLDVTAFSITQAVSISQAGSQLKYDLPVAAAATTNKISAITVQNGRISVHVSSMVPFESYLRQPIVNPPNNDS